MITTTYDFSSGTGFTYDASKFVFGSGHVSLALASQPETFSPDLSAATYDHALLEYISGALRQKDQRPASATFYAALTTMINANWGGGSLTITPVNGAAISGGSLDLTGGANKYVTFAAVGNTDSLQTGTVEFQVIPNYTGTPGSAQVFFCASRAVSSLVDLVRIRHFTDGFLYLTIKDQGGFPGLDLAMSWSPTAGQTYTIKATFDGTVGQSKLYIDGALQGTDTTTFTRSGAIVAGSIGVGEDLTTGNADFAIKNVSFYSAVVNPTSPALSPTIYATASAAMPELTVTSPANWTTFSDTEVGAPRYTLNGDYWNGSAWVASNATYAQANDATTINAHISSLTAATTMQVVALYNSTNSPQSSISAITVGYGANAYFTDNPTIKPNAPLTLDQLTSFVDVISASGSDGVQWYLLIGALKYYWDGAAWTASDGAYGHTSPAADILAHASTLPVTDGVFFTPVALLHSADGSTTPTLTSLTVIYDYFGPEPGGPNLCTIFGYVIDETKAPVPGAVVTINNPTTFFNQGLAQAQGSVTATTNAEGYFSVTLAETTTVSKKLNWSVKYAGARGTFAWGNAVVPNSPEVNFSTLTFTP